jgi:pantoate--beta-alanine ligase
MQLISTVRQIVDFCREAQRPLGLIPTMGSLHQGHMSLVRQARKECAIAVVTIFVNGAQFDSPMDLARYPRRLESDLALLEEASADVVFAPSADDVYPQGYAIQVRVAGPALPLEGEFRAGYFQGVATVMTKLLIMTLPDMVYLGQKDGQQAAVIKRLVSDLNIPAQIRVLPTVREPDGLAMSSRNVFLGSDERIAAPVVYRALQAAQEIYDGGERGREALEGACRSVLDSEPLVDKVDYVALVNPETFTTLHPAGDGPAMLAVAVRFGSTRLIDNVILGGPLS